MTIVDSIFKKLLEAEPPSPIKLQLQNVNTQLDRLDKQAEPIKKIISDLRAQDQKLADQRKQLRDQISKALDFDDQETADSLDDQLDDLTSKSRELDKEIEAQKARLEPIDQKKYQLQDQRYELRKKLRDARQ